MAFDLSGWLWSRTWWSYADAEEPLHAAIYRGINLVEGLFWFGFAAAVLWRRHQQPKQQRTRIELAYAAAFLAFGLTDFRESIALQSWLIWVKLVNLIVLLLIRRRVMKTLYPKSKLF